MTQGVRFPVDWEPPWGWHSYSITGPGGEPVRMYELPAGPMLDMVKARLRERIFKYRSLLAEFKTLGGDWTNYLKLKRLMYADESMLNYLSQSTAVQRATMYPPAVGLAYHLRWLGAWGLLFGTLCLLRARPKTILEHMWGYDPMISPELLNDFDGTNPEELSLYHSEMPLRKHSLRGAGIGYSTALRLETKSGLGDQRVWIKVAKYFDAPARRYLAFGIQTRALHTYDIKRIRLRASINMITSMLSPGIEFRRDVPEQPYWLYTLPYTEYTVPGPYRPFIGRLYNMSTFCVDLLAGTYVSATAVNQPIHPEGARIPVSAPRPTAPTWFAVTFEIQAKRRISIDIDRIMILNCGGALPIPEVELGGEKP